MLGALLLAAISGSVQAHVQLDGHVITARDLSSQAPADNQIIATIVPSRNMLRLSAEEQRRLLRNRYPGLSLPLRHDGDILLVAGEYDDELKLGNACYATRHEIASGTHLYEGDVATTACDGGQPRAALGYDRAAGAPFATSTLPAFSYVGALKLPSAKPIEAGRMLTLRTTSGPVTIDRSARALQAARPGQRVFVQTSDGDVLTLRLAGNSAEEDSK